MTDSSVQGTIWKVDRHATHDGPGIRTALYFKGCPLRCKWCSNPEGQSVAPDLVLVKEECNGCGICLASCPAGALSIRSNADGDEAILDIERTKCDVCGDCGSACPTGALQVWGKRYSVPQLLAMLNRDRSIHRRSGGGVTCTGGEALMQSAFLREFLAECARQGIHSAVETAATVGEEQFAAVASLVDHMFIDLKHIQSDTHKFLTGKSNGSILRNTRAASSILERRSKPLVIRMVVVPGVNDGVNVAQLADFLSDLPHVTSVELLPYHRYGTYKYDLLGQKYRLSNLKEPTPDAMEAARRVLRSRGLTVA